MNNLIKIVLYAVLAVLACTFGHFFYQNYSRLMDTTVDEDATHTKNTTAIARPMPSSEKFAHVLFFGGAFFVTVVGLAIMAGHDFSNLASHKFGRLLYNDEGETIKTSDYEIAEQKWADGEHLEAIQIMRDFLLKNPTELHVAIRIAEIYEKDLHNPLAAALEYEDVLKHRLPAEQWGWTAIHLCNLYSSKLNKPGKAVDLLKRIIEDHPNTGAAEKARKRLEATEMEAESEVETAPVQQTAATPAVKSVAPVNNELQNFIDRFHQTKPHSGTDDD